MYFHFYFVVSYVSINVLFFVRLEITVMTSFWDGRWDGSGVGLGGSGRQHLYSAASFLKR
jgi:hypothetical protein